MGFELVGYTVSLKQTYGNLGSKYIWLAFENGFCTPALKLRPFRSQAKSSVETKLRAVLLTTSLKWAVG